MVQFIDYDPTTSQKLDSSPYNSPHRKLTIPKLGISRPHLPHFVRTRKFWIKFSLILAILLIPIYIGLIRPGQDLVSAIQDDKIQAAKVQVAVSIQDVITANKELDQLDMRIEKTRQRLDYFGFTEALPWISDYYRDSRHLLLASQYGIEGGKIISEALLPFGDVLGLNGKSPGTAEDKLQKIVEVMPKIAPRTDEVAAKLTLANKELGTVNPARYPEKLGDVKLRETLKSAKDLAKLISDFMPQAKDVLTYAPIGLGSPNPKTYMVVFQNDKELRPSGGFLTAYTFATMTRGKVTTDKTDDIYNLDVSVPNKPRAPTAILRYLPLVDNWNLRDANLSPDFRVSMGTFESMYRKSAQYRPNNGYIGVDTYFLQSLLRLTGPVKTASTGDTFTADNVVEKMEVYAEKVFLNAANRKGFLGELMKEVMGRITKAKSDQWSTIIQTLITSFNEKHILLDSKDQDVQKLIEKYDWAGRIKEYDGDYLHINDTNFAGAKANLYITEKIIQEFKVSIDGEVTKKVTVEVTNPAKSDGFLNGPYRDWVRMYVPKGSQFVSSSDGDVRTGITEDELGKTMFENFFIARPLGYSSSNKATWSVTYKLPFKVTGHELKLLQQKQPGVSGPDLVIKVNGQVKISEPLKTDKEFTISF